MSKGIGKSYLNRATIKWHREDIENRYFVPTPGGLGTSMPRYWADIIYTKEEKAMIAQLKGEEERKNIISELQHNPNYIHNLLQATRYKQKRSQTKF